MKLKAEDAEGDRGGILRGRPKGHREKANKTSRYYRIEVLV